MTPVQQQIFELFQFQTRIEMGVLCSAFLCAGILFAIYMEIRRGRQTEDKKLRATEELVRISTSHLTLAQEYNKDTRGIAAQTREEVTEAKKDVQEAKAHIKETKAVVTDLAKTALPSEVAETDRARAVATVIEQSKTIDQIAGDVTEIKEATVHPSQE